MNRAFPSPWRTVIRIPDRHDDGAAVSLVLSTVTARPTSNRFGSVRGTLGRPSRDRRVPVPRGQACRSYFSSMMLSAMFASRGENFRPVAYRYRSAGTAPRTKHQPSRIPNEPLELRVTDASPHALH